MENKNLLILGGSGKVGQWVVKIAKKRGYNITVVVRSKTSIAHIKGIHIIEGSVLDEKILERAILEQDMVVSCLGIKRESQSNPWSKIASPEDFTGFIAEKMIPILKKHGIKRVVLMSAAGVGDSWQTLSGLMKLLVKSSNIKLTFNDFNNMEKAFVKSRIDCLSVRPVGLVDTETDNQPRLVNHFKMSSQISRKDVAQWMMEALERKGAFKQPNEMIGW